MTYPCKAWFWDRVCAISEYICDTVVHKGQRDYNCYCNTPLYTRDKRGVTM